MTPLIAEATVVIHASAESVWQVLTRVAFIRQWDDVPEGFEGAALELGSEFVWEDAGRVTRLTVVDFAPCKRLRERRRSSAVASDDVAYTFTLSEGDGHTELAITVGDWADLPDGASYYENSVAFAKEAAQHIKALAEV